MTPATKLRAVTPSPEQQLRRLFTREDELIAELAQVREEQRVARNEYAAARAGERLLMLPSFETLRKVVGA